MNRKRNNNNGTLRGCVGAAAIVTAFALAVSAQPAPSVSVSSVNNTVTLHFIDSAMVNDTLIRIGDIAKVECADAALAERVRTFSAGEAAPAGFSRYVNSGDLVMYNVQPQFKDARIVIGNTKRVKVTSDYQEKSVSEFEDMIRSYAAEKLEWKNGDWTLTIINPQASWKGGRGSTEVMVSGIDNPYAKGHVNLNLIVRHGSRVHRVPVACQVRVKTEVLVAARPIQRGEEFNGENSKSVVMDITNFTYAPLTRVPEAGTMTTTRTVSAGNILHGKMLKAIPIVARGDQVRIHFIGERIKVSVLGTARDSGGSGDRIWVENLQTGKLIRAAVSGKGSVVVHQEGERI